MFLMPTCECYFDATGESKIFPLGQELELLFQGLIENNTPRVNYYARLIFLYVKSESTVYQIDAHHSNEIVLYSHFLSKLIVKADDLGYLMLSFPTSSLLPFNFAHKNLSYLAYRIPEVPILENIIWYKPHQLFLLGSEHIYAETSLNRDYALGNNHFVFQLVTEENLSAENQKLYYRLTHYYNSDISFTRKFEAYASNEIIKSLPVLYLRSLMLDQEGFMLLDLDGQFINEPENYLKLDLDYEGDYEYNIFLSEQVYLDKNIDYPAVTQSTVDFILNKKKPLPPPESKETASHSPALILPEVKTPSFFQRESNSPEIRIEPPNKKPR